jgi:DNA-binding CsgD family transcriptional regulator
LWDATDGDLRRSPRFQKIYEPAGLGDELRVAFASGERCWAVASLSRALEMGPFAADEIHAVRDLVPIAARAVRSAVIRRDGAYGISAPAVLIVDDKGRIDSATPDAQGMLDEFAMTGVELPVPTPVMAAARRAMNSRNVSSVTLRARGSSGRWFRLHASPLGDGRVAVVIEAAAAADLVPILLESYGLTSRESEVIPLLARGLSTKQIAAEMCISRHTVGDHIKLIFEKCGVASRGELVAKVFTEHLLAGHKAATSHV